MTAFRTKPDTGTVHTPGPWTAKWSKYREGVVIVQAGMPSNRVLAQFDGDGDGPDEQSLADANLIAAAPDLLAVLKSIRLRLDPVSCAEECAKADAAIDKAEGRS